MGVLSPERALRRHDELQEHLFEHGLVLSDVPFVRWVAAKPTVGTPKPGIITSEGCACEVYERALDQDKTNAARKVMLQVAPLRQPSVYGDEKLDLIKGGHVLGLFFVKGEGTRLGDSVVDLACEQSMPAWLLAYCTKSALISDRQWKRLLIHLTVSRWRQEPENLFREDLLESASDGA